MDKNKKYFPSMIKYRQQNPSVSVIIPLDIKTKLDEICLAKGLTKSQYFRELFIDSSLVYDDIKAKHRLELQNIFDNNRSEFGSVLI